MVPGHNVPPLRDKRQGESIRRYRRTASASRTKYTDHCRTGSRARRSRTLDGAAAQSSGSIFTIRWSWLLPTQNVVGVVELSTNTVRMLVSDGIRYCTALPVLGSSRTTRSVCIVDAQISPFLSKLARYGYVRGGKSYSVNFSALVSNTATLLPRYSVTTMRS